MNNASPWTHFLLISPGVMSWRSLVFCCLPCSRIAIRAKRVGCYLLKKLYLLFSLTQEDVLPTAQTLSLDFPDEPLLCGLHSKPHTVRAQNTLRSQWHFTYLFPKTDTNDKKRECILNAISILFAWEAKRVGGRGGSPLRALRFSCRPPAITRRGFGAGPGPPP